jgi:hypothetical protein
MQSACCSAARRDALWPRKGREAPSDPGPPAARPRALGPSGRSADRPGDCIVPCRLPLPVLRAPRAALAAVDGRYIHPATALAGTDRSHFGGQTQSSRVVIARCGELWPANVPWPADIPRHSPSLAVPPATPSRDRLMSDPLTAWPLPVLRALRTAPAAADAARAVAGGALFFDAEGVSVTFAAAVPPAAGPCARGAPHDRRSRSPIPSTARPSGPRRGRCRPLSPRRGPVAPACRMRSGWQSRPGWCAT